MRTGLRLTLALLAWLAAAALAADAPRPARLALVIGNGAYRDAPLPNPVNDAADMARALEKSGFTVIRRENASLREMHLALREFGDRLGRQSVGLVYFAGHGLQVRGRNFLVPVDADIAREDEVAFAALDLAAVMEKLDSAKNGVNIVILDACRNNPFGQRFAVTARGLAPVEAPPGTLIAFATAPGSVAADGSGRNGLYTEHLLAQMDKPGTPVEETLKAVRAAVRKASANAQVPWENTSLESEFSFRPTAPKKVAAPAPAAVAPAASAAREASPFAPPNFRAGDKWSYVVRNLLDGTERTIQLRVKAINGSDVLYANGEVSDLIGNYLRTVDRDGTVHELTPAAHWYMFPMRAGATYDLVHEDRWQDKIYDVKVRLRVAGEEQVDTPAGRFRAVRVTREAEVVQRDKPSNVRRYEATYWYSAAVKRWVAREQSRTRGEQRLFHERSELTAYAVQ